MRSGDDAEQIGQRTGLVERSERRREVADRRAQEPTHIIRRDVGASFVIELRTQGSGTVPRRVNQIGA